MNILDKFIDNLLGHLHNPNQKQIIWKLVFNASEKMERKYRF